VTATKIRAEKMLTSTVQCLSVVLLFLVWHLQSYFTQCWNFAMGRVQPLSSWVQALIFEWKSVLNFNPCAKISTYGPLPSSFRLIPTLILQKVCTHMASLSLFCKLSACKAGGLWLHKSYNTLLSEKFVYTFQIPFVPIGRSLNAFLGLGRALWPFDDDMW